MRAQEPELKEGDVVKVHDIWSEAEKSVRTVPEPKKFLKDNLYTRKAKSSKVDL